MTTLASTGSISWLPGLSPRLGWAAAFFYLLAAWQCARLARGKGIDLCGGEAATWRLLSVALLVLGIYKLFDLQTEIADQGRLIASEQHWYLRRRPVQAALILGVAVSTALGTLVFLWLARRMPLATRAAAMAALALLGFVAIRTVSFHAIDRFLDSGFAGLRVNWVIELAGIFAILLSTRWRTRLPRKTRDINGI